VLPASHQAIFAAADIHQVALSPKCLATRHFPVKILNTVLDEDTGELMEYCAVMKNPKYRPLYATLYTK
jgi:hypothetical protein